MRALHKGFVLALLQVLIVGTTGLKLVYDRATRPRVWAMTRAYDPDLPIRGRYLSLQLVVETEGIALPRYTHELWGWGEADGPRRVRLEVRNGKLVAVGDRSGEFSVWFARAPGVPPPAPRPQAQLECGKQPPEKQSSCWDQQYYLQQHEAIDFPVIAILEKPVLYFIPEHAPDPSLSLRRGSELWAEVTIPKKGAPRPIQLALKKDGVWTPLDLH